MSKIYGYIIIALVSSIYLFVSCQKAPSDIRILQKAASIIACRPDSALTILQTIEKPEKLYGEKLAEYALLITRAKNKLRILQTNDSLIRIAAEYYRNSSDRDREVQAYYCWGCIYKDMRQMDLGVQCFLHALKVMPEKSEKMYLGAIYGALGDCYSDQELFEDAMQMYRKAHDTYCEQGKKKPLFYAYRGIAFTFFAQMKPDSALTYYEYSLNIAKEVENKRWISIVYEDIARVYDWKKEYQKAYECLSFSLNGSLRSDELLARYCLKGRLLRNLHQLDSARYYLNVAKNSGIYGGIGSYNELYELEKSIKNYPAAIAAADSLIILFDSLRNTRRAVEIAKTIGQYEAELYKQKLSTRYKVGSILLLCIALTIIVAFLWIDKLRRKKYLRLQSELTSLRSDMLQNMVDENVKEADGTESQTESFEKRFARKMNLCLKLFEQTEAYNLIEKIEKQRNISSFHLNMVQRQNICDSLYESLGDVMTELKIQFPILTKQDLLYCLFWALKCSKQTIILCVSVSEGALKTRKSRVREKIGPDMFDRLFA